MEDDKRIDQKDAISAGLNEATIEAMKLIPGLNVLIAGVRKYEEQIENQQRRAFIEALSSRVSDIEEHFKDEWYTTSEAQEFVTKTAASALNAEYADKVEFFANMLLNATRQNLEQMERLKFLEMVRHLSKPALVVLAAVTELHLSRGSSHSPQVDDPTSKGQIISNTGFEPLLVAACIDELRSVGVLSSEGFAAQVAGFTSFTLKFVNFIKDPSDMK